MQGFAVFRGSSQFFRFYLHVQVYPKISCKKNETSKKTIITRSLDQKQSGENEGTNKGSTTECLLLNHGRKLHIWHGAENDKFINLKTEYTRIVPDVFQGPKIPAIDGVP